MAVMAVREELAGMADSLRFSTLRAYHCRNTLRTLAVEREAPPAGGAC